MKRLATLALCLTCFGCGSDASDDGQGGAGGGSAECNGPGARFATGVAAFEFGTGQDHGQDTFPDPVLGPPSGGGCCMGSLEVTSLGSGGYAVLEFAGNTIVDGEGPDFIVFENPFLVDEQDPSSVFAEIGKVSVSSDGQRFTEYPCTRAAYPYDGCAGWHPVLADSEATALDPATAGGDAFDLAELGLASARYVRIDDRTTPDDAMATFDLDAVAILNAGCP